MRRTTAGAALAAVVLGLFGSVPAGAQEADTPPAPLRLVCRVVSTDPGAVACEWSPSESRAFHGYRLVRHDDVHGRTTVFRTNRRLVTTAVDRGLRPGRYRYWLGAFSRSGRVIGASEPVEVEVGVGVEVGEGTITAVAPDPGAAGGSRPAVRVR